MSRNHVLAGMFAVAACTNGASADEDAVTDTATQADASAGEPDDRHDVVASGCEPAQTMLVPSDPSQHGPWVVGARTVSIAGLDVEVWYPARDGSGSRPRRIYDIRDHLPPSELAKISENDAPKQLCECQADLPIDEAHGPFPVIVFVHGTAGFRTQSLHLMTHWASRGFVVLAADHPGLQLFDLLAAVCGEGAVPQDTSGDVSTVLAAVRGEIAGLEWLTPHADVTRVGLAGHSAGGRAVGRMGDLGQVIVPMAAEGVIAGSTHVSTLVLGATADAVVAYGQQVKGYENSPAPKRLLGLDNAGHLAFSDICALENADGQDLITIAMQNEICGAEFATSLFQCDAALLDDADAWALSRMATTAAFEETLRCRDIAGVFSELSNAEGVFEVRENL